MSRNCGTKQLEDLSVMVVMEQPTPAHPVLLMSKLVSTQGFHNQGKEKEFWDDLTSFTKTRSVSLQLLYTQYYVTKFQEGASLLARVNNLYIEESILP